MHKSYGLPRGFGFVTYADPKIADKVLEEEHIIGGRKVEFSHESTMHCHFSFIEHTLLIGLCLKSIFYFLYKVEVKKTILKKDMHVKGASNTKKIFVGGLPLFLTKGKENT